MSWNRSIHRDVVCVFHPAVGLGVRYKRPCEFRWAPTLNGVADILAARDEDGKHSKDYDGPQVVQSVCPVIIRRTCELGVRGETSKDRRHTVDKKESVRI
ncbi:innexin [Plakobranchus ocellatus]|uniref:Innexin n=1 Tax=Plakobranchus ocellatus TaxID=259542 RepID=A0AAV3Y902_9GAST|nr:innexin [Plakobranchus ocellatus]